MSRRAQRSTLVPYTTLFRSCQQGGHHSGRWSKSPARHFLPRKDKPPTLLRGSGVWCRSLTMTYSHMGRPHTTIGDASDRKSTRLNSSHVKISYAVFCLKKKR